MIICSAPLAFLEGLGGPEVVLIFIIILVLFGGEKLPEFARGAGKMMREFKKAASGVEDEFKRALEEDEEKKKIAPPTPVARAESPASSRPPEALPAPPPPAPAPPPKMLPDEGGDHPA